MAELNGALSKTGVELFRELIRVYPTVEVEDYYKNGIWKEELMKTDLQLIFAHRKEGGAPDPPPLEEVQVPELPKVLPGLSVQLPGANRAGVVALTPTALKGFQEKALVQMIDLFIVKHKLHAGWTKELFKPLEVAAQRFVVHGFKPASSADTNVIDELERYIGGEPWNTADASAVPSPGKAGEHKEGDNPDAKRKKASQHIVDAFVKRLGLDQNWAEGMLAGLERPARRFVLLAFKSEKTGTEAQEELAKYAAEHPWEKVLAPVDKVVRPVLSQPAPPLKPPGLQPFIDAFITRYRLEEKAQSLIKALSPADQRSVMQGFETSRSGAQATEDLENYIASCQKMGTFGPDAGSGVSPASHQLSPTTVSHKRPLPLLVPSEKRPRLLSPVADATSSMSSMGRAVSRPLRPGLVSPGASGGLRPVLRPVVVPPTQQSQLIKPTVWSPNVSPRITPALKPAAGGRPGGIMPVVIPPRW